MKCTKCGADVPDGARVCPNCECAVVRPAQDAAKKPMLYGIIALAAIAVIALLVAALAQRNKPVTVAVSPETQSRPVTSAPAPPMPARPITQAPAPMPQQPQPQQKVAVPQEVLDYLEFVKQIETKRQELLRDQSKALALAAGGQAESLENLFDMAMDPDSNNSKQIDPFKPVREELSRQVTNWQYLIRHFDTKPAPVQCGPFAGAYRMAVASEAASIHKVTTIMSDVSENSRQSMTDAFSELQAMRKDPRTQGGIDKAVETADAYLVQLCKQYNIPKPFEIPKEQGGASLIGL